MLENGTLIRRLALGAALAAALFPLAAAADEGMWTFNNFPAQQVGSKYGFTPDQAWLDRVRLASVRLSVGCSGSLVSPNGLVMTNHHCASECIQQLSTAKRDYSAAGYLARKEPDEIKCPALEIVQLTGIEDVTDRVKKATAGLSGGAFNDAQKAEIARIEKACGADEKVRCDVVSLYRGGQFNLYRYRRYQDVRLVFAPEFKIAFFGGDPDNFTFPRYDLDVSFFRIYENNRPVRTSDYFVWNAGGAKAEELVFVSGNPGSTRRLLTVSQLEFLRDVAQPSRLLRLAELRGVLSQFSEESPEHRRIAQETLFGIENSYKGLNGQRQALLDRRFFASKVADEKKLRDQVAADPVRAKAYGQIWDEIAAVQPIYQELYLPYTFIEGGAGFNSELFAFARTLVRGAAELPKPNDKRLKEYTDSALPQLKQELFTSAPIYNDLEEVTLRYSLTKLRENLGTDDPLVRKVLGKRSPAELAHSLVTGSKLADVSIRRKLWEGGAQAVAASDDPLIRLAQLIDPDARAIRKRYEDGVEAVEKKNGELLARVRFDLLGTNSYPDATFSPRLSYGAVQGYQENGRPIAPFTTLAGAFDRATGEDPFALPQSWLDARSKLDLSTPFNFVCTCDIIGGNSGSPVINQKAEVVGLIFDGNIHSLGGAFGFDPQLNRAVAVTTSALTETLKKVYGADRIVAELTGA